MIGTLLVLLASGQPTALIDPPRTPLVCRYEMAVIPIIYRRKMCLTQAEWDQRDNRGAEAARKSIYELMGNTACVEGGLCTDD